MHASKALFKRMLDRSWPAVAVTLVVITAATQFLDGTTAASIPGGAGGCPLTQFRCATGHCVNLNVFCDGRNDCGDNSDEPAQCTHCNRTYYAGAGENYRLQVTWPNANQMPFTCYLTFASATHDPSELLQVRVDTATIGQYVVQSSELSGRCPDGWMQIWEGDQPVLKAAAGNVGSGRSSTAGAWCGASIVPRFYYTESTAVTFVLRLLAVPTSLQAKILQGSTPPPVLDLTYKVLSRSSAVVRYGSGGKGEKVDLGEQMAGTMCSRSFRQCGNGSSVQCRVQSPGYPGLYPRNAHCLYRISHRHPSTGQQQLSVGNHSNWRYAVTLWQRDGRKINLRDSEQPVQPAQPYSGTSRTTIRSAADCEASGDLITIYDGASTSSPILARFCDGPLPEVTSSGPDVTIEFRSSPHDTVYAGSAAIEGFELNVRISQVGSAIVSADSPPLPGTAVSDMGKCQWNVTSSGLSRGVLTSPHQTWPLNTLCHFRFQGRSDERVWIYFIKYHFAGSGPKAQRSGQQCRNSLRISDGDGIGWDPAGDSSKGSATTPLPGTIAIFCRDRPPPLCERHMTVSSNQTAVDRSPPCLASESFTSTGSLLSVQQYLPEGTAFTPWRYALAYEFFRPRQTDGHPLYPSANEDQSCDRLFTAHQTGLRGTVKSPQNVFLFGRGGAPNLRCTYRFQGDETMRVAIEVTRLRLGKRNCRSELDSLTHQRHCIPSAGEGAAFLQLQERPWGPRQTRGSMQTTGVLLTRDCLCETALLPFRYVSTGSDVEVVFQVDAMAHSDDYHDFFFEIAYEFLAGMKCSAQSQLIKPLQGPGGLLTLDGTRGSKGGGYSTASCNRQSWFLQPRPDRFIFVSTAGYVMNHSTPADFCPTKNRIVIYSEGRTVICPSSRSSQYEPQVKVSGPTQLEEEQHVLLSPLLQFDVDDHQQPFFSFETGLVIEFIAVQSGLYQMKWLELMSPQTSVVHHGATTGSAVVPLGSISSPASAQFPHPPWLCATWCPELKACIDSQLWCDGVYDCPSGLDESDQQCGAGYSSRYNWTMPKVYWYLVATGSTLLVLFIIVSSVLVCRGNTNSRPARLYEVNGGSSSGGNGVGGAAREMLVPAGSSGTTLSSSTGGGSFRISNQQAVSPLNDTGHAYPSSRGVVVLPSVADQQHIPSYFDKKLAVS